MQAFRWRRAKSAETIPTHKSVAPPQPLSHFGVNIRYNKGSSSDRRALLVEYQRSLADLDVEIQEALGRGKTSKEQDYVFIGISRKPRTTNDGLA
jgi:hypothetical protein